MHGGVAPRSYLPLPIALAVVLLGPPVWAEERAPQGPPAPEAAAGAPGSTIQGIVDDLSAQVGRLIGDMPRPRIDLVAVAIDGGAPGRGGAGELPRELLDLLLGSIGRREPLRSVRAGGGPGWQDEASARSTAAAQGWELLVWLEVSIESNHLVVEGTVYETERHLWRDAAGGEERRVVGRVFARARVDAEVRGHLGPLVSGPLSYTPVPLGEDDVLALAVADLDGDDLNEIVLVGQRGVEVRRLRQGQAELVARLKLAGLPPAATRSRDPVGTVAVGPPDPSGARPVALRTSELGEGQVIGFDGREIGLRGGIGDFPIRWDAVQECTTITPGRSTFQTEAAPCGSLDETPMAPPFHAVVRERLPQPGGLPAAVAEGTVLADGTVALRWNDRVVARIGPFGTALAITDLEDDGVAEVLLSSDRDPGTGDELTVVHLGGAGQVGPRVQLGGVAGSVWVAASGDADNDGLRELLAIAREGAGTQLLVVE
jgi:hypothetical protein